MTPVNANMCGCPSTENPRSGCAVTCSINTAAGPRLVVLRRAVKAFVTAPNDGVLATRQAACLNRPNGTLIYGKEKRARPVTAQSRSYTGAFPSIVHALPSDFYLVPTALVALELSLLACCDLIDTFPDIAT